MIYLCLVFLSNSFAAMFPAYRLEHSLRGHDDFVIEIKESSVRYNRAEKQVDAKTLTLFRGELADIFSKQVSALCPSDNRWILKEGLRKKSFCQDDKTERSLREFSIKAKLIF